MPRVPFSFSFGGMGNPYAGAFFDDAGEAFGEGVVAENLVLAAIAGASETPTDYGITLPPTNKPYHIRRVFVETDTAQERLDLGVWNGSALVFPLGSANGIADTGPYRSEIRFDEGESGLVVKSGYIPALVHPAGEGSDAIVCSGYIDWEE